MSITPVNRVNEEEFVKQIKMAVKWAIWINPELGELELMVENLDGSHTNFHGPDYMDTTDDRYRFFLKRIEAATQITEVAERRQG